MRKLLYYLIILTSCANENVVLNQKEKNISALVRDDNSYVSYKDTISKKIALPIIIENKINAILSKDKTGKLDCVFLVSYSDKIQFYICKVRYVFNISYSVILYNNKLNKISENVINIDGTYIENNEDGFVTKLVNKPLLEITDIDSDGIKEIILRERVHNGNSYNAVIAKYYKIINESQFKKLILIEERNKYVMNSCIIERELKSDFSLNSFLNCKDSLLLNIGIVKMDTKTGLIYYKKAFNDMYEDLLITGSGNNELKFAIDFN